MIHLAGVSKWYRMGEIRVTALNDISVEIGKGEFDVVLGPSGSGKTTLLNLIGALDVPSAGTVQVNGKTLSDTTRQERFKFRREMIGFVFQTFNLFPTLTALENVQFVLDVAGKASASRRIATDVLTDVRLGERLSHFLTSYQGASSRGWPLPAPWPRKRRLSWLMSPPANSISGPASRSLSCWQGNARWARLSS